MLVIFIQNQDECQEDLSSRILILFYYTGYKKDKGDLSELFIYFANHVGKQFLSVINFFLNPFAIDLLGD